MRRRPELLVVISLIAGWQGCSEGESGSPSGGGNAGASGSAGTRAGAAGASSGAGRGGVGGSGGAESGGEGGEVGGADGSGKGGSSGGKAGNAGSSGTDGGGMGGESGETGESGQGGEGGDLVCTPNQAACVENRATSCNADGSGFDEGGTQCSSTQTCMAGNCYDHECEPSGRFCSGNTVRLCAADGLSSVEDEACGVDEYCAAESAECTPGVCEASAPACDGNRATACNADGSGYLVGGTECDGSSTCEGGECKPHICPPDELFCQGQDLKRCAENGLSSAVERTCADQACVESADTAACTGVCVPGQTRCAGNAVETCTTSGDWGEPETCQAPLSSCQRGECTGGMIAVGMTHSCVLLPRGAVRCWGSGSVGQTGYAQTASIGDNETPASAGDVDVGGTVTQIATGDFHTCALLSGGTVRCWGSGTFGVLGYGNNTSIGDNETPASAGDVNVGGTVTQIDASGERTCALLSGGTVRCWGRAEYGALGYSNLNLVGVNNTPAMVGDVNVGGTVTRVSMGRWHTCVLLSDGAVRCWGYGGRGALGYGNTNDIGDNEHPAAAGNVNVGGTVVQLAAGGDFTCALLDDGAVRCWGAGTYGKLGRGNTTDIGDNETPAGTGSVFPGIVMAEVATGQSHACAVQPDRKLRCWGWASSGQLGYGTGTTNNVGDNELPATAGYVNVGGPVSRVAAGFYHTCALLTSGAVRCWGAGSFGMLGYGNNSTIGDDETPESAGDVPYE